MRAFNHGGLQSRISRRTVLRGAGVALTLPWLESLAGKASAQSAASPKRFVAVFLPCGGSEFWKPPAVGVGANWQLSAVLDPLTALKSKVNVITGLETGSCFYLDGSSSVQPADGRTPGAWLTCSDAAAVKKRLMVTAEANGISADQVMAPNAVFAGQTALPSMQIGLSSILSYCDGVQCSNSRSVSWNTETTPMGKLVNPSEVFSQLTAVWSSTPGAAPSINRDARISVLDAVQETAGVARKRLSASDKQRLDEFLTSVRSVETRVTSGTAGACAPLPALPSFPYVDGHFRQNTDTYNKGVHADLMNELLGLALQCDRTRIASYMLEDERSEFVCDHIPRRTFTALTSTPSTGTCPEWHGGGQQGSQDDFASIVQWNVGKIAELCQKLAAMPEANGLSVLDNSVIFLGSGLEGSEETADRLPAFTVGGGGGRLKTDQHLDLGKRPLRDFYFTLMNGVYDMGVNDFGVNLTGAPIALIKELLNT
jgi:hypothetical protein